MSFPLLFDIPRLDPDLKDWVQITVWIVGVASALAAFWQYRRGVKHRMAETFMKLDERFRDLKDIARQIDPESGLGAALNAAAEKSVAGKFRVDEERKLIGELDEFLRFLLLLSRLEKNTLLSREGVGYMYSYWFTSVRENPILWSYVTKYYKNLRGFMEEHRAEFKRILEGDVGVRARLAKRFGGVVGASRKALEPE